MLIKFQPDSTHDGWYGLFQGISLAATSAAGSNPTAPNGIAAWEVISDTVAGGWTQQQNTLGTSGQGFLNLYAPVANSSIAKTKGLELYYTGTQPTYSYQGRPRMYVGNSSGAPIAYQYLDSGSSSATSTSNYNNWNKQRNPSSYEFIVAATSEYLYIWWADSGLNSTSPHEYTLIGVADHSFSSEIEEGNTTQHCPFYGIEISGNNYNGQTTNSAVYYNIHVAWLHHLDPGGYFNAIISGNQQYIANRTSTNITAQTYVLPIYPDFENINLSTGQHTNYQYVPNMFNASGKAVPTINEILIGHPGAGNPFKVLKGLSWIGLSRNQPTSEWNNKTNILAYTNVDITTDENTPKVYRAYPAGNHLFGVLKQ
jgi:hypothetical protein